MDQNISKLDFLQSKNKHTIIVCDGILYGNNVGTIVRQCALLGCDNIIFCQFLI